MDLIYLESILIHRAPKTDYPRGEKGKWKCSQADKKLADTCLSGIVCSSNVCLATGGQRHQVHAARRSVKEQQQRGRSEYPGGDHADLLQNLPQCRHLAVHQGTPLEETR